jgi:PPOX class probable F420-dependent enzyme
MGMSEAEKLTKFQDLFDKNAIAHFATLMPDGAPQVTPVWVDFDGEFLLINTARGRQKDRNVRRNPRVGVEIMDPDNSTHYVQVRGRVVEILEAGALEHAERLSRKYTGQPFGPLSEGQVRVVIKILPEHVNGQ